MLILSEILCQKYKVKIIFLSYWNTIDTDIKKDMNTSNEHVKRILWTGKLSSNKH